MQQPLCIMASDGKIHVPTWSGLANDYESYKEEVYLYAASVKEDQQCLVAPRLIQRLSGAARQAALRKLPEMKKTGGHELLLEVLENVIGRTPQSALASQLEHLFSRVRRQPTESMSGWYLRFVKEHELLQRTLQRVRFSGARRSSWTSYVSRDAAAEPTAQGRSAGTRPEPARGTGGRDADEDDDDWEGEDDYGTIGGWRPPPAPASPQRSSDRSAGRPGTLPEVVPEEVLGWLLLSRAGLSQAGRAGVLAATGNSLRLHSIAEALRSQYPDSEIIHDGKGKGKHRRHAFAAEEVLVDEYGMEAEAEEQPEEAEWQQDDEEADFAQGEIYMLESELDDEETVAAFQALRVARRTMKEAHDRIREGRLARGFHDASVKAQGKGKGKTAMYTAVITT